MLFLFNQNISSQKKIIFALTKIYGINISKSKIICKNLGFNPNTNLQKLSNIKINHLIFYIEKNIKIEDDLKQEKYNIFNYILNIKTYKGIRHTFGLPLNGQRTHTNRKTAKKFKNKWIKI